jgi:hypothetical protein
MTTTFRARAGRRTREQTLVQRAVLHPLHAHPPWLILLLCLCAGNAVLLIEPAAAQTEWKDRPVTLAIDDQKNPQIALPADKDYTIIVWEDYRHGDADLYMQKIHNETGFAMWQPFDGVPVCTAAGNQVNPRAAYDTTGGVIVVWEDYRIRQGEQRSKIYAQRFLVPTGEIDPVWKVMDPTGILVCAHDGRAAERPRISGTGEGAFISWVDHRNWIDSLQRPTEIRLQYLLSTTAAPPSGSAWDPTGTRVSAGVVVYNQSFQEMALDDIWWDLAPQEDAQGVVLVYQDERDTDQSGTHIPNVWADAFDRMGNRVWGDLRMDATTTWQALPRIVTIDSTDYGYVVVWEDARAGHSDIYAQRVTKTGTMAWTPQQVCGWTSAQMQPDLVRLGVGHESRVAVAWHDQRNGNADIYADVLDVPTGAAQFGNGIPVVTAADAQVPFSMSRYAGAGGERVVFAWNDGRDPAQSTGYYQEWLVDATGVTVLRQSDGVVISRARNHRMHVAVGQDVFVFTDMRRMAIDFDPRDDIDIYAQKIGMPCDVRTEVHWNDVFVRSSLLGDAANHRMVVHDSGKAAYHVWDERRMVTAGGDTIRGVYIQKTDANGVLRWANNGLLLSDSTMRASHPDVCMDHEGGAYVIWQQRQPDTPEHHIVLARIRNDQTIAWRSEILMGGDRVPGDSFTPVLAPDDKDESMFGGDGPGAWFIFLNRNASVMKRYFGRMRVDNALRVEPNDAAMYHYADPVHDPMIVKDRRGGAYMMTRGNGNIYVEHVDKWLRTDVSDSAYNCIDHDVIPSVYASDEDFPGYDIACDPIDYGRATNLWYFDALVSYVNQGSAGGRDEVELVRYYYQHKDTAWSRARRFIFTPGWQISNSSAAINPGDARHPVIDCSREQYGPGQPGGAMCAWDHKVSTTNHAVHTNYVLYSYDSTSGNCSNSLLLWESFGAPAPLTVQAGLYENPQVDIARIRQDEQLLDLSDGNRAAIVWIEAEGGPCVPLQAVYAQYVEYLGSKTTALQWPIARPVSPGAGSYSQMRPIVKTNIGSEHAWVSWLDSRGGHDGVAATIMYSEGGDMQLERSRTDQMQQETSTVPSAVDVGMLHPNPAHLGTSVQIPITLNNAETVTCRLYNALGMLVASIYDGPLQAGTHVLVIDNNAMIRSHAAGVYYLVVTSGDKLATRKLLYIR